MYKSVLKLDFFKNPILPNYSSSTIPTDNGNRTYIKEADRLYRLKTGREEWDLQAKEISDDFPDKLIYIFEMNSNEDLIISIVSNEFSFYICDGTKLTMTYLQVEDVNFDLEFQENDIQFGRFYADHRRMGAMIVREGAKNVEFYEINPKMHYFVLEPVNKNPQILNYFCPNRDKIFIKNLRKQRKNVLISGNSESLCIFEFRKSDWIQFYAEMPYANEKGTDGGELYFPKLTSSDDLLDMVAFNSSGIYVYLFNCTRWTISMSLVKPVDHSPIFFAKNGWTGKNGPALRCEDVRNDDCDEMIFTGRFGVEVLSYNSSNEKWTSLLPTALIEPEYRESKVLHVIPQVDDVILKTMFLTSNSGQIRWAKMIESITENQRTSSINQKFFYETDNSRMIPKIRTDDSRDPPSTLYLRDQNIWFEKTESVNPGTGKPNFVLPLVGEPESKVKFHIFYNERNKANAPLGVGWSSPQSFIALDYHDGNFAEDENYVMLVENVPYKLRWLPDNSSDRSLVFDLAGAEDRPSDLEFKAEFDAVESIWRIDYGAGFKQVYGKSEDNGATLSDVTWKNWRGKGFDGNATIERCNTWYLAAEEYGGTAYYYDYAVIRRSSTLNGQSYNSAAFLKRIYDKNTEITFSFSSNPTEKGPELGSNEITTLYLKGYTYRSRTKEQIVLLKHAMIEDSVILTSMFQKSDYAPYPVVAFEYEKFSKTGFAIQKIVLPTGAQIIYEYTRLGKFIPFDEKPARIIPVSDDYLVAYGPGFALVSYVDTFGKEIALRMFNYAMTEEIYPDPRQRPWSPIRAVHKVQSHQIMIGHTFIAVIIYHSPAKTACLFGKNEDGSWRIFPLCYEYDEDAILLSGSNFVVAYAPKTRVSVIEWIDENWILPMNVSVVGPLASVAVYKNKFVVYDDQEITMGYKTPQVWTLKVLAKEPEYLSETQRVVNMFDLKPDFGKGIMGFFRNNAIQLSENLIVLSSLTLHEEQEFRTKIKTFVIGRAHEVAVANETYVQQDKFSKLYSEEETNSKGDKYSLKYVYTQGTFQIVLNTFRIYPNRDTSYLAEEISRTMNSPAKRFLLDLNNYFVSLQGSTVQCRNVRYSFGGSNWHRSELKGKATFSDSASISIGDRFFINKTDADSNVNLIVKMKNENITTDLRVKDLKQIQMNYPVYIAAQEEGKPVRLIVFTEDNENGFVDITLPESKEFVPFGNAFSMVTHKTDARGNKTLFIYAMHGIRRQLPDFVVKSQKLVIPTLGGDSVERITGYDYDESSVQLIGSQIRYSNMTVLPGNSKQLAGFFRITDKSTDFFNAHDELIKTVPHKAKGNGRQGGEDGFERQTKGTAIFDVSGSFEIASYAPFNATSGMAGYISFENYEVRNGHWNFEDVDLVRDQFSLTGRNHLRLVDFPLKGKFRPHFQDRAFIASSWIRTPIESFPNLGDIVPYLTLTIYSADGSQVLNVLSDVKFQLDDWFYLEAFVDLDFVHSALNATNRFETGHLQVLIRISPLPNIPVDVDNARFSSIDSISALNVYDEELGRRVAVIKPNGAIVRYIYDEYKVQIAEVNESNQIKGFITYTKGSISTAVVTNPACKVTLVPETAFYVHFSPFSFRNQLELGGTYNWTVSPGSLYHDASLAGNLHVISNEISQTSYGIRFVYLLKSNSKVTLSGVVELERLNDQVHICLARDKATEQVIPAEGEILLLKEGGRVIVWINGRIYIDQHSAPSKRIGVSITGEVRISQMMVFSRPQVQVAYKNALNEEIQLISLKTNDAVLITEKLYDQLGRQRINVQPVEVFRSPKESLLSYSDDLVINKNPKSSDSVWQTGKLEGKINDFVGHKFGFSETVYARNPLNIRTRVGRPGEIFAADGKYAIRFDSTTLNSLILSEYPQSQNFTYDVQILTPGTEKISVFDEANLMVASLTHVAGARDVLATFKYDGNGKLIELVPPVYYDRVGIFDRTGLNLIGISYETEISPQNFSTTIDYDDRGNPIGKSTPDSALLVNVYDEQDQLRFVIQHSEKNPEDIESTTYFLYDDSGRVAITGHLKIVVPKDDLLELQISEENSEEFQQFFYSYTEREPAFRDKIQRSISRNHNGFFFEEFLYDSEYNVISKRIIAPNGSDRPQILAINKKFQGGLLKEILYPTSMFGVPFRIAYEYDRLGRMTSVGVPGQTGSFLMITYNANNQIESETYSPASSHQHRRIFQYNEAGFPTQIADSFLTEEISYTEGSYTNNGYGDGRPARVKFIAKWLKTANSPEIGVHEDDFENSHFSTEKSRKCFRELKKRGYLDAQNRQTRVLYGDLEESLPLACSESRKESRLKQVLGKKGFPEEYGFRFDYGEHVTLKYAKYFVGREDEAINPDTFAKEIPGISEEMSKNIWNCLVSGRYISANDWSLGEPFGRPLLRATFEEMQKVIPDYEYEKYTPLLDKLMMSRFRNQSSDNSRENIGSVIREWFGDDSDLAQNITEAFFLNNYQKSQLDPIFISTMHNYNNYLPQIVGVMQDYFARSARSEFDIKTTKVDANGNRQQFFAGFEDYKLVYEANSNRISEVQYKDRVEDRDDEVVFEMRHDSRGNVVRAMHKGIETILYHPVSNRVQSVHMENGNVITFGYDAKGERVHKQLSAGNGTKMSETDYLRDEIGRTLLERKRTYSAEDQEPDLLITIYIHGPKNLVGFVRRDQFYSVISDHQGSVRLIVREGEVVAAYDYMPYGSLMRIYGRSPEMHIAHRYTGQEWDEDIGLYNYHARLYDPSIGRFYQIDPVLQALSPYSYVYNSPVSMVDPSGKVAVPLVIAAIIGFGVLGAYIYGADANSEINPMKWDWSSRDTQMSLVVGAITGAMIPIGFVSSFAALTALTLIKAGMIIVSIGVTVAYLSTAAANKEWNALKWDYKSPTTWSALLEGFSAGVGIIGSFRGAHKIVEALHGWKRYAFGGSVVAYGAQAMYFGGSQTDWDVTGPEFWLASSTSIFSAPDLPSFAVSSAKYIGRHGKSFVQQLRSMKDKISKLLQFQKSSGRSLTETIKKLKSLFGDGLAAGGKLLLGFASFTSILYTASSVMQEQFQNWDITQLSVYHNLLSASHLTANFFEVFKFVKQNIRLKQRMPKVGLAKSVKQVQSKFASAVGNINLPNWKQIKAAIRIIRSVRRKLDLSIVSNVTLTTKCTNIAFVYTYNRFADPFYFVASEYLENLGLIANIADCVESIAFTFKEMNLHGTESCEAFLPGQSSYEQCENAKLKTYSDTLANWQVSNYAEPPIIHSKATKDTPNAYDLIQNFDYLSSYELEDLPILNSFEKCFHCINVTSSVRNIVRDIEWLTLLNAYGKVGGTNKRNRRAAIGDNKKFEIPEKNAKICENRIEKNWVQNIIQKSRNLWFVEIIKSNLKSTTKSPTASIRSEKPQGTPSNSPDDILGFGNHFLSQLANNGTLLLFEALLAKYKNRKIYRPHAIENPSTFPNQELFACEVIELYEELLKDSAKVVGFDVEQLEMSNSFELYTKIIDLFAKNEFEKIISLLRESAIRTLSFSGKFGRETIVNAISKSNFISKFDQLLKEQLLKIN